MARYSRSYSSRGSYSRRSSGSSRSYSRGSGSSYGRSSSRSGSYRSSSRPSSSLSTRSRNGYSQYRTSSGGWKFTHRRVAEKKMGGRIRSGHEVHHVDGNKRNNRPSNLRVLSKSAHRAIHSVKRIFKRWK